jgi:hypothetical protein
LRDAGISEFDRELSLWKTNTGIGHELAVEIVAYRPPGPKPLLSVAARYAASH